MRDFLVISLLFTLFSFFSNQVLGQDKTTTIAGEESLSHFDEDSFVGPRLPPQVPETPSTLPVAKESKARSVNFESIDDNGILSSLLTIVNHKDEVSVFEWQGTALPLDVSEELERLQIDLSTLEQLPQGVKQSSNYKAKRRQPDVPGMEVVAEEVKNINGEEFTIMMKASKDGQRKKITITGPDDSEKSYRWDGAMPDSIHGELNRLQPPLLRLLDLDEARQRNVSIGLGLNHEVVQMMENGKEQSTETFKVIQVRAGGPADQAGLEVGDEVLSIDGRPLSEDYGLTQVLSAKRAGDEIEIKYRREHKELKSKLKLVVRR